VKAPTSARTAAPRERRRSQLSDEVAQHLREAIMTGTLRPGTFIRLDETAAKLGVSITPVREALLTLRGEGMVQLEPRRGYVVVPMSRQDIADIYWLQATMAKELAASAIERLTDAQIDELERANDELARAVVDGDPATITAAEFGFHRLFNRATGRVKLSWFLHVARYMPPLIYVTDISWGNATVDSHRRLIDALRRHDRDALARIVDEEFADGAKRLIEQLERNGMWS
jgi:DNA-binding GntR family transcriptional regulator